MMLLKLSMLVVLAAAEREHATDIEIQQVEVYEVPWQEESSQPQQPPQQGYGPPQHGYGPPSQEYGPPQQQYGPPQQEYGPPQQEYGPPQQEYGPPPKPVYGPPPTYGPPSEEASTTESEVTTTEVPTTTGAPFNNTEGGFERLQKDDNLTNKGVYYIYHPEGRLQRVVYSTKDDVKKMEYSARLTYENVQPIRGPIYTYDQNDYVFRRVSK
ncbi:hypothetical protein JTB14_029914 [Gonioctena quinquepunctata]|nr:hypothetical protein JTB14_029914 [Gonioctena quinquepunctata]